jgi:hypothetical protein
MQMLEAPIRQSPAYWDWWANTQDLAALGLLPEQELLEEATHLKPSEVSINDAS